MAERAMVFRLPLPGLPRARFVTDYGLRKGRLLIEERVVLDIDSHDALQRGVCVQIPGVTQRITVQAIDDDIRVSVDGVEARREDRMVAPISRSAWKHGWLALAGSAFGFVASYLYVGRARAMGDDWSLRMAWHMAAWHLLLTLTLFPASIWGQRPGIRAVQATSALFLVIHVGIAIANTADASDGPWIAFFNSASGLAFLVASLYGQRAYADMNPLSSTAVDAPSARGTEWQPPVRDAD